MEGRGAVYFVSDVHLGLDLKDPAGREARFVAFLRGIPRDAAALYLLGDIWDFWYEWRDVVPKGYVRVFAQLLDLMDNGVKVYFFPGNHDIWCYHYFADMGITILRQPYVTEIGGKTFCLGHGDGLGPGRIVYKAMRRAFHCRALQRIFSLLHPWIAFRIGQGWSRKSRVGRNEEYVFKGAEEPLYKYAEDFGRKRHIDYFIFGHYHVAEDMKLPCGAELFVLKDWMDAEKADYLYFSGTSVTRGYWKKME